MVALFFNACAHSANNYQTNPDNARLLIMYKGGTALSKIAVGEISKTPSGIDMGCRVASSVSFQNGESVETYIKNALINEFKAADIYSESSEKKLSGNIDFINLDSFSPGELLVPMLQHSMNAKWSITMTFKGNGIQSFSIPSESMVPLRDGFFDFGDPCDNPSRLFSSAVADLIKKLVDHPSFKEFISN